MERELLLLGILRRQRMHGYQLTEFIDRYLVMCTDLKKPTAYFLLEKMRQKGWVTFEMGQEGNRPPRRVYQLTPQGEVAFQQMLRESLVEYPPIYFNGDMGLAFLDALPPAEVGALLKQRRDALQSRRAEMDAAPLHPGGVQWMVEHQRFHLSAELDWLDELIRRISALPNKPSAE